VAISDTPGESPTAAWSGNVGDIFINRHDQRVWVYGTEQDTGATMWQRLHDNTPDVERYDYANDYHPGDLVRDGHNMVFMATQQVPAQAAATEPSAVTGFIEVGRSPVVTRSTQSGDAPAGHQWTTAPKTSDVFLNTDDGLAWIFDGNQWLQIPQQRPFVIQSDTPGALPPTSAMYLPKGHRPPVDYTVTGTPEVDEWLNPAANPTSSWINAPFAIKVDVGRDAAGTGGSVTLYQDDPAAPIIAGSSRHGIETVYDIAPGQTLPPVGGSVPDMRSWNEETHPQAAYGIFNPDGTASIVITDNAGDRYAVRLQQRGVANAPVITSLTLRPSDLASMSTVISNTGGQRDDVFINRGDGITYIHDGFKWLQLPQNLPIQPYDAAKPYAAGSIVVYNNVVYRAMRSVIAGQQPPAAGWEVLGAPGGGNPGQVLTQTATGVPAWTTPQRVGLYGVVAAQNTETHEYLWSDLVAALPNIPPGAYMIVDHVDTAPGIVVGGVNSATGATVGDWLVAIDGDNDGTSDAFHVVAHDVVGGPAIPPTVGKTAGDTLTVVTPGADPQWVHSLRAWQVSTAASLNNPAWNGYPAGILAYALDTATWYVKSNSVDHSWSVIAPGIMHGTGSPPTGTFPDGVLYVKHS